MKTESATRHLFLVQEEFVLGKILVHLREDGVLANRAMLMLESGQLRDPVTQKRCGVGSVRSVFQSRLRSIPREHMFQLIDLCTQASSANLRPHLPGKPMGILALILNMNANSAVFVPSTLQRSWSGWRPGITKWELG